MQVKRPYSKLPPQNYYYLSKITSPKSPYNNNKIPNIINLWNSAQRNNHRATIKDEDEDEERGEAILLLLLLWNPTWPVSIAPQDVGRRNDIGHGNIGCAAVRPWTLIQPRIRGRIGDEASRGAGFPWNASWVDDLYVYIYVWMCIYVRWRERELLYIPRDTAMRW